MPRFSPEETKTLLLSVARSRELCASPVVKVLDRIASKLRRSDETRRQTATTAPRRSAS